MLKHTVHGLSGLEGSQLNDGMGRAVCQVILVGLVKHAERHGVGRAIGLAVLTQALAHAVVLELHRTDEADVRLGENLLLVLNLVEDKGEDRPEALELGIGAGRLDKEVWIAVDDDVDQSVLLGVDFPDGAALGFLIALSRRFLPVLVCGVS